METTQQRRMEGHPSPPPLPQPKPTPSRSAEEDFEETLGSLVNYYATLPPGALEASVRDQQEKAPEREHKARPHETSTPRMRIWPWILGGAGSMMLGGVITFALIVGRVDFWRAAEPDTNAITKVTIVTPSEPEKTAEKGIPQAEPLQEAQPAAQEAKAETETPKLDNDAKKEPIAAAEIEPQKPVRKKAHSKTRRARRDGSGQAKSAAKPKKRNKKSGSGLDDWEDPYK